MKSSTYIKRIVIIAGQNGAGLSPFALEQAAFKAGRLMLEAIAD